MADKTDLRAIGLFKVVGDGHVKAVWIISTNPVVDLPDADRVRRALVKYRLVVASDTTKTADTTALADVLLPTLGWDKKDGTMTSLERHISHQHTFLSVPDEARAN